MPGTEHPVEMTTTVPPTPPPTRITSAGFADDDRVVELARKLASLTKAEAEALARGLQKLGF